MGAPAWVGIGAQRSGTAWFTGLLTQHPQVGLGTNGKKEQQLLHKVADGRVPAQEYLDLFPDDGVRRGDFSPQYLRHPSCGVVVPRLLPDAPILVLLRDPVERYRSAMRLAVTRGRSQPYPIPINLQTWAGFYADQLDTWASFVGRERLHVMVYEQVREDAQLAVDAVWRTLGLDPVPLSAVDERSRSSSSSEADWDWPEGTRTALQVMYRPQARRLADDWGLDVSRWESLG
ncbi:MULTISPECIES: sulfotransferase [unclassified Nocardioides]|uniref:sulfotransferase n=1 Tax=unclassified Nocardioides TaxID=2615069 RepID=UPI0009F07AA5|nr:MULTISPECIES: sulfotransferase [unclassified Nocardioides]GAW48439.1 Sulfotransferase domain superfamily [Nocardioides sp. PD653-B2]GAW53364.1 Sulfotransferase domain superfamily [Nocardioides sp. PD653]